MEQNVAYLYEYQNGKRVRNIGFLRMERKADKCLIQIHAKQMDEIKGIVFQRENGEFYTGMWGQEEPIVPVEQSVTEYLTPRDVVCEKIKRQDLSRLPRKEWRLANNSFLLHGFYNYHHLLYIEERGEVWIGVPGIYHEKEKVAANAFGFTEFRRMTDVQIELSEEERNTCEDFGYWCRQIPTS